MTTSDGYSKGYVSGYAALAHLIASDEDHSTAVYRRFDRLSARNLLYLQGELEILESELDAFDDEDLRGTITEKSATRNIQILKRHAAEGSRRAQNRLDLHNKISSALTTYREALLLEHSALALKPPVPRVRTALQNAFNNVATSQGAFPALDGLGSRLYEHSDLVSLRQESDEDRMTRFLRNYLSILFVVKKTGQPLTYVSEARIQKAVGMINVLGAAGLLFGAIYNLYYVKSDQVKLGLITAYVVVFALFVGVLTSARRSEIFGACAAYAAVLVVFVSSSLGGNEPERSPD